MFDDIYINLRINAKKAERDLESFKKKLNSISNIGNNFSENFSNTLKDLQGQAEHTATNIGNAFRESADLASKAFSGIGSVFKNVLGYSNLGGLLKHYININRQLEWLDRSNQRRFASNSRSDAIVNRLSGDPGYVRGGGGYIYKYRKNTSDSYDRNILNQSNYFPGSRRWQIANGKFPFTKEDLAIVREFGEAFNDLKYNFELITLTVGREMLPRITSLVRKFSELLENSKILKNVLTYGLFGLAATEGIRKSTEVVLGLVNVYSKLNNIVQSIAKWKIISAAVSNPFATAAILGTAAVGYGNYKLDKWLRNKENIKPITYNTNLDKLGLYSGVQEVAKNNNITYNIDNIEVKSNPKVLPELLNSIGESVRGNSIIMNQANYGGLY